MDRGTSYQELRCIYDYSDCNDRFHAYNWLSVCCLSMPDIDLLSISRSSLPDYKDLCTIAIHS